ncbi:MAG: flagellar biosynthesis protein FlhA [Thermodesulfovibrionales bacterium]|nr:flagellar biosynthesis protein FlhA [Thermodesulfovibrionales bacterium]
MKELIKSLAKRGDVIIAGSVVGLLGLMILPIPPFLLDIFLSVSISLAIVILISAVCIRKPLDFSAFPSILLITTLFRLALNVSSTRLILLRGNEGIDAAGEVIKSFGSFVVGGNYAVGFTVFLILIIVNFVVITKGSGRIAEVAARFTLDAMPGKQMAIDADLNAGLIDEAEARRRRALISQEADFYGAMDGASKFVRGDAIAGLIITIINIIGGLLIGTIQKDMTFLDAARTYTILTIGDGLVSQIPALLISTAAGIVISRAGGESDLGRDITSQIFLSPKALIATSIIMVLLGFVPGLPNVPFFILSAVSAGIAYAVSKPTKKEIKEEEILTKEEEAPIETFIDIEPLTFEIGYGLIPLVESEKGTLLGKIKAMRRQIASELGFIVPSIHIKDNLQLRPHEYSFLIRGIEVARGEVMIGYHLAVVSKETEKIEGIPTKEPVFGLPAYWIEDKEAEKAQQKGYMVVDPATVIATHITELIRNHAWELLTRTEVQAILDKVTRNYPKLVDELIPSMLSLGSLQRILQNLLKEKVPINDIVTILETLLDYAPSIKDVEVLTEYVRQALSRFITKQYVGQDGAMYVVTLDPQFEILLSRAIEAGGAISPDNLSKLIRAIEKAILEEKFKGSQPIILCSQHVRRFLRKIVERFLPSLVILSNAEVSPSIKLYTTGVVKYED